MNPALWRSITALALPAFMLKSPANTTLEDSVYRQASSSVSHNCSSRITSSPQLSRCRLSLTSFPPWISESLTKATSLRADVGGVRAAADSLATANENSAIAQALRISWRQEHPLSPRKQKGIEQSKVGCPSALCKVKPKRGETCKTCHGPDGTANPAIATMMKIDMQDLKLAGVQAMSDDEIKKIIAGGKGKMRPVTAVSGAASDDVVAYVRSLKK